MTYIKSILLLLGLLVHQEVLFAQSYFNDFLKDQGLTFKKPQGYQLVVVDDDDDDDDFEFYCFTRSNQKDYMSGEFYLHNKDKSVIILILDDGYTEMKGIMTPYWYDDNQTFYQNAVGNADTTKAPIMFYNADELKTTNADGGAEFVRRCDVPGNVSGYRSNRSISISKTNQGNYTLLYLFKDTSVVYQNKVIDATKNMLTYNVEKQKPFSGKVIFDKHYITVANDIQFRGSYAKCKMVVLHKNNIGTMLLKYYYKGSDSQIEELLDKTWGFAKFNNPSFFSENKETILPF